MCPCGGHAGPGSATLARPGLIIGTVGYQPEPVEPPADGNALICCCRPQGDIVIDL